MAETNFHRLLRKKIEDAVRNRSDSLSDGAAIDYPHYRENVGYIHGMLDTLKLCDEIEQELNQ